MQVLGSLTLRSACRALLYAGLWGGDCRRCAWSWGRRWGWCSRSATLSSDLSSEPPGQRATKCRSTTTLWGFVFMERVSVLRPSRSEGRAWLWPSTTGRYPLTSPGTFVYLGRFGARGASLALAGRLPLLPLISPGTFVYLMAQVPAVLPVGGRPAQDQARARQEPLVHRQLRRRSVVLLGEVGWIGGRCRVSPLPWWGGVSWRCRVRMMVRGFESEGSTG